MEIVDQYMPLAAGEEAHWEVVERVLFLYYKLNPGVKYVQVGLLFSYWNFY